MPMPHIAVTGNNKKTSVVADDGKGYGYIDNFIFIIYILFISIYNKVLKLLRKIQ